MPGDRREDPLRDHAGGPMQRNRRRRQNNATAREIGGYIALTSELPHRQTHVFDHVQPHSGHGGQWNNGGIWNGRPIRRGWFAKK